MYGIKCVDVGFSKDPFLTQVSDFAVLFGNELDAEVSLFFTLSTSQLIELCIHNRKKLVVVGWGVKEVVSLLKVTC